jgi:isochorismate pyruvate lyase
MGDIAICASIEEVRSQIDQIDRQIVALLAKRGGYVKAPQRVEQVIAKVKALAAELGANPSVTEQVYRAMISGFIDAELAEHAARQGNGPRTK